MQQKASHPTKGTHKLLAKFGYLLWDDSVLRTSQYPVAHWCEVSLLLATWAAVLISITPLSVSSLFRGMFAGGLKEMEQEEVLIHGVSYNAMCQILHFIYTSELELSLSNVQETLVAACQLQVSLALLEQGRPVPRQGFLGCPLGSGVRVGEAGKDTRQLRETSQVHTL